MATTETRLMLLDPVLYHLQLYPSISLNIFIDDLVMDHVCNDNVTLVQELSAAAFDLAVNVEAGAGLPIARNKSAVLSNVAIVAQNLRKAIGSLGGTVVKRDIAREWDIS